MDTNSTKALIEQFHQARSDRDTEKLASLMSDDVVLIPPIGFREVGTIVGRAAVAEKLSGKKAGDDSILNFDTIKRTLTKLVVEGDTAVAFFSLTAEKAAGGTYSNEYVWGYTCADGKVTRLDEYADTLHASKQLTGVPLFED